jgi:hypothetical protein
VKAAILNGMAAQRQASQQMGLIGPNGKPLKG